MADCYPMTAISSSFRHMSKRIGSQCHSLTAFSENFIAFTEKQKQYSILWYLNKNTCVFYTRLGENDFVYKSENIVF